MKPPKGLVLAEHIKRFYNAAPDGSAIEIQVYGRIGACWWDDGVSAASIAAILREYPSVSTINIRINSLGGSVFEGSAIYNQLARHPAKKVVDIDGVAASAASWIAMVGDERRMGLNGFLMIHEASGDTWGPANEHDKTAALLRKMNEQQLDIYQRVSNLSRDELRSAVAAETWYTAQEALDAGFLTTAAVSLIDEPPPIPTPVPLPEEELEDYGFKRAPDAIGKFFSFGNASLRFDREAIGDGVAEALMALGNEPGRLTPTQEQRPGMVPAPVVTTQPTTAATPAAAAGDKHMNPKILQLLGLPENADQAAVETAITAKCQAPVAASEAVMQSLGARNERDALARATELNSMAASLMAQTDSASVAQALGTLTAWRGSVQRETQLVAQISVLEKQVTDSKRDGMIEKLSADGKLPPSLHPWARTQTAQQLEVFAAALPAVAFARRVDEPGTDADVTLTDVDKAAAKALGISNEKFLASKKRDAEAKRASAA